MKTTKIFDDNIKYLLAKKRYIVNQGGTRSGKTYAILQLLLCLALYSKKNIIISVVSESFPHLRMGAVRDFKKICYDIDIVFEKHFNKSEFIFDYNGNIIEFFSCDNLGKVHGPGRDFLFINECNNIKYEIFEQLEIRTAKTIFLDYNPVAKFWVHKEILKKDNSILLKSNYLDNLQNLTKEQIESIESKKDKKYWWQIYGLGEIGFSESLIFNEEELNRFELKEIDLQNAIVFSYTDTAKGKTNRKSRKTDFFCTVFCAMQNNRIYVIDVIFNRDDITINRERLKEKIIKYNSSYNLIETNQEYTIFSDLNNYFGKSRKIIGIHEVSQKRERILARADFILDYFYFLNVERGEYKDYLENLYEFDRIDETAYEHDDAPDATAGAAKFAIANFKFL